MCTGQYRCVLMYTDVCWCVQCTSVRFICSIIMAHIHTHHYTSLDISTHQCPSVHTSTHQHTAVHTNTVHIHKHQHTSTHTHTHTHKPVHISPHTSTHQHTPVLFSGRRCAWFTAWLWPTLIFISTHQYASVHVSTRQYTSTHCGTHQYCLVRIGVFYSQFDDDQH